MKTLLSDGGSEMKNAERNCSICDSKVTLIHVQEKWICEKCLQICNENRAALWKDSIEKLMKEYGEACYTCLSSYEPEDVYKARVLGRKIRTVLQFIGLPKKHGILLPIRKVQMILKKIGEGDMLLHKIKEQNEENKVNSKMVSLLSIKQKKASERLAKNLPNVINDSYYSEVKTFVNEELFSYILLLVKEKAICKKEVRINELVKVYNQSDEVKGKSSSETIKLLHEIGKRAKSLSYIYNFINEVYGEQYQEKEIYYKDIQRQIGKVDDTKNWLDQVKRYENKIDASNKEINAVKDQLEEIIECLIEKVELDSVFVKES